MTESEANICLFDDLPDDVLSMIYSFFPTKDILTLRLVSQEHFKSQIQRSIFKFELGPFNEELPETSLNSLLCQFDRIQELHFHQLNFKADEIILKEFSAVIDAHKGRLQTLSLNHCAFEPLTWIKCLQTVSQCKNLTKLGLNTLRPEGFCITILSQMVSNQPIELVDESGFPIENQPILPDIDLTIDTQFLTNLREFDLKANSIGNNFLIYIQRTKNILAKLPNLHRLDLFGNSLGMKGLDILRDSFEGLNRLEAINLGLNTLAMQEGRIDRYFGDRVTNIRELSLEGNWFQDTNQMEQLAVSLSQFTSLRTLDMKTNRFGDPGVKILASGLKRLTTLEEIYFHQNRIGDAGIQELWSTLALLPNLTRIDFTGNAITCDGAKIIGRYLSPMENLDSIDISFNKIQGDHGLKEFLQGLSGKPNFRKLSIKSCSLSNEDFHDLSVWLESRDSFIQYLDCRMNITTNAIVADLIRMAQKGHLQAFETRARFLKGPKQNLYALLSPGSNLRLIV